MVGLIHPSDLQAWQRWQTRRRGVRGLLGTVRAARRTEAPPLTLTAGSASPKILIAVESLSPSQCAALLAPVAHLAPTDVAVLAPSPVDDLLPSHDWRVSTTPSLDDSRSLDGIRTVLGAGHFLAAGAAAHRLATTRALPFGVVQHGLLVPMAPPLPPNAHLLAWTAADGTFWRSGRTDVSVDVVGSQLFWESQVPDAARLVEERMITWAERRPVYLGQLHGAEIGRLRMARAALRTLRRTNGVYRPHPQERDVLSRLIHWQWQRAGVTIDRSGVPLTSVDSAVLGVFSTGLLEAAARGIPAWADFDRPPAWLAEFWQRYRIGRLGDRPTAPPLNGEQEPALAVANWLAHRLPTEG